MVDRWPMVGREREMAELHAVLGEAAGGSGVVLAGRAGVGKSRLAEEAARAALGRGWTVRCVAATATSQPIPLGAFGSFTDDRGGEAAAMARRVVQQLVPSRSVPAMVVIDDAHLLDDLSALVVHQLVWSRAAVVVLTLRTGVPAPAAVTGLWREDRLVRMEVAPLARGGLEDLVAAVLGGPLDRGCADELWRVTGGNALYLRKLVEAEQRSGRLEADETGIVRWRGALEVTDSLADLVDAHIGERVRDVVDLAALAEPLGWRCLSQLVDHGVLEEAEQQGLIRIADGHVFVGHPMYAEVRLARCGSARLRRLRGQVARAMTDGYGPAGLVKKGLLWLESDLVPDPTVLATAATAATSLLDFATAQTLYTAAADAGLAAQTRVPLAYAMFMTQQGERALQVLDGATDEEESPSGYINDVVMRASNLLWAGRSPEQSWRVIDDALEQTWDARRHQLLVFRANELALAARPSEVVALMSQVRFQDLDPFGAVMGYGALSMAHGELGRTDEAAASAVAADHVMRVSEPGKLLRQTVTEFHAWALVAAGRLGEAMEVAQRHLSAHRDEPPSARLVAEEIMGMVSLATGDVTAALRLLPDQIAGEAADNFNVVNSFPRFHVLRAHALARVGDAEGAARALQTAHARAHPAYVYLTCAELLAEAWVAAARMQVAQARRLARRAAQFARDHEQFAREVWCLQTAVQFDDTDAAERLAELVTQVPGPRSTAAERYASAVRADDAAAIDQASLEWEALGDRLAAADAAGQAAVAHRRAGQAGSALTSASRCHRLLRQCGATVSPVAQGVSATPEFTPREREVALMVAQGLTNQQIAAATALSVRTVESHLYRASTKAGVTGRSALAAFMRNSTN